MLGNIFHIPVTPNSAICITTNGIVKKNGHAVMGRGVALEADKRFDLSLRLGYKLRTDGNHVFYLGYCEDMTRHIARHIITFPTKNDWRDDSDIDLIRRSACELVALVNSLGITTCYLPRPGCSNGHLDWKTQVRPVLEPVLDDRFVIVDLSELAPVVRHMNDCRKQSFTACFTGPRPKNLHGYDPAAYIPIYDYLTELVTGLSTVGAVRFITGGAQGIDQLACQAVNRAKESRVPVRNSVYVPFAAQPSRWMKTGLFSQEEWKRRLDIADDVQILADDPPASDRYGAAKLLTARNHAMVESSDLVIAFLTEQNRNWNTASGGTAECVRYAYAHKKPILAIHYRPEATDPFTLEFIPE